MKYPLRPAVFLDRDGTINRERNYLHRPEEFEFIPGAPQAIRRLNQAGLAVVVVTNQSGVARGYFKMAAVLALHDHLQRELARIDAQVDGFYVCPHHPAEGSGRWRRRCQCRKGRPGLLLQAARELGLDLERSYLIGDKVSDLEAARAAGCRPLLVLTGYGREQNLGARPDISHFPDLQAAAAFVLDDSDPTF